MATDPMSGTRQGILDQLLEHKNGMTVDEIIAAVGISRTAVNQHLIALERRNFIQKGSPRKTGGRPVQTYILTQEGTNQSSQLKEGYMTALEANALCGLGCSGRGRLRSGMKRMTLSAI